MAETTLTQHNQQLHVSGAVDFNNVVGLREQGFTIINQIQQNQVIVDFSAVTKSDSSGLALMLSWQRYAHKKNKKIHFVQVPDAIQNLAISCQIKEVLWIN